MMRDYWRTTEMLGVGTACLDPTTAFYLWSSAAPPQLIRLRGCPTEGAVLLKMVQWPGQSHGIGIGACKRRQESMDDYVWAVRRSGVLATPRIGGFQGGIEER